MKIITEFTYDGKTYYASNLDKKLKKLKINKEDITIVREFEEIENNKALNTQNQEKDICNNFYFWDKNTNYTYITASPDKSCFDNNIWNDETKTGIKGWTKEFINSLILLSSKPKYPIELDKNNEPILETFNKFLI